MPMHHWGGGADDWWLVNVPLFMVPLIGLVLLLAVWSLIMKGLGLWHAARRGEYWWFLAIMLINTCGILELIYLFFFAKLKFRELFSKHTHHK